jgi:two-component system chemotaxis response regulator CheY
MYMALRIFIVDDEKSIIDVLMEIFETNGYEVVGSASNGEDALSKYATLSPYPDIVIMDHRLPMKTGLETMTGILRMDPSARVLFVSADPSIRKHAIADGAVGFVLKPFNVDELLGSIQAVMTKDERFEKTSRPGC